jgi:hypothetical protein
MKKRSSRKQPRLVRVFYLSLNPSFLQGRTGRNTDRPRKMNLIRKCLARRVLFWERPVGGICCLIAVAALPGIRQGNVYSSRMFLIQKLRRATLPWQITSRMDGTKRRLHALTQWRSGPPSQHILQFPEQEDPYIPQTL